MGWRGGLEPEDLLLLGRELAEGVGADLQRSPLIVHERDLLTNDEADDVVAAHQGTDLSRLEREAVGLLLGECLGDHRVPEVPDRLGLPSVVVDLVHLGQLFEVAAREVGPELGYQFLVVHSVLREKRGVVYKTTRKVLNVNVECHVLTLRGEVGRMAKHMQVPST